MRHFKQRIMVDLSAPLAGLPDTLSVGEKTELVAQVIDCVLGDHRRDHIPRVNHLSLPSYRNASITDVETLQLHYNDLYLALTNELLYHRVDAGVDEDTLLGLESIRSDGIVTLFRLKEITQYSTTSKDQTDVPPDVSQPTGW